jgi:predicted permease
MSRFLSDVRFAFRTLRKSPGFTIVALLTLALALGANTAIFSFVDAVLLKPLPYPHADRIIRVLEAPPGGGRNGISTLNYLDWARENTCFEFMAAISNGGATLTSLPDPIQVGGNRVSPHYFDIFGVRPVIGRSFVDGEDQPGKDHVVVLSHTLWQNQFGGDAAIVGRTIELDRESYTVVGVLPKGTALERGGTRFWRPLAFKPENMTRDFHWFWAVARLKEGVTLEQARAQMDAIGARIAHDFPASNKDWGVGLDRLAETMVPTELKVSIYVLLGAVAMVLLIACANLANLSLMRVVGREREIAIRIAVGAGRGILIRQFLTESLVLSLAGAALGLFVGHQTISVIRASLPGYIVPSELAVGLDGTVLLFSFGLAALTAVIIGLFPALHAARPDLTNSLKQGGSSSPGSHGRIRSGLVVAEVALAFVLLTGAGLLIRSLDNLGRVDPGFDATNVLTFRLPVSDHQFADVGTLNQYVRNVRERLQALPGVTDVGLTSALPMQGWGYGMPFQIADQQIVDRSRRSACFFKMVSPSYFRALRMRLLQGRTLAENDQHGAPAVTVINETMAKRHFAGVNPIGKRLLVQEIVPGKTQLGNDIAWEIVGVVADEKVGGLGDDGNSPGMYVSMEQSPVYFVNVLLRSATDTALLREAAKKAIHELNPNQVVFDQKTLEQIKEESLIGNRIRATLLGTFAGLSLLLASMGIYAVISYSIAQRTREIGVRTALGATRADIAGLVLRYGLKLAAIGLALGIAGAFGFTRVIASMLFGVGKQDPLTLSVVAFALAVIALVAALLPAHRATKVDPLVALRCE